MNWRQLGRTPKHRRALFRNLSTALFTHERIITTEAKAKEMKPWIERLIKKAMVDNHRFVASQLFTSISMKKLFREIVPRFVESGRQGNFTRFKHMGRRKPDSAKMAMIEILGNPIEQWER